MVVLGCTTQAFRTSPFVIQSRIHSVSNLLMSADESTTEINVDGSSLSTSVVVETPTAPVETNKFERPAIFVGNIPIALTAEEVETTLRKQLGTDFEKLALITDRMTGQSRGFGYVTIRDDAVDNAVVHLKDIEINGRILKVDIQDKEKLKARNVIPFNERQERQTTKKRDLEETNQRSVYIGNLPLDTTREEFRQAIESMFGTDILKGIRLSTFPETQKCKGFGHVEFVSREHALDAIEKMQNIYFRDRLVSVSMAGSKKSSNNGNNGNSNFRTSNNINRAGSNDRPGRTPQDAGRRTLFIGNLPWKFTKEMIEEMLGDVIGQNTFGFIRIATDKITGRPRGFAHVEFVTEEIAKHAVATMNGMEVMGRTLRVDIAGERSKPDNFDHNAENNADDAANYSEDDNGNELNEVSDE